MAMLLCSVVLLTNEKETPESLILSIKTGAPGKRWQKAFELSNELNKKTGDLRKNSLLQEITHILRDPSHYDSKTRAYMAVALSHFDSPDAASALKQSLQDKDPEIQLYTLWALGVLRDKSAMPDCVPFVKSDNAELRKISSYVLGVLGDKKSTEFLRPLLNDPVSDVRWNTALALARLGDSSGKAILFKMLDRKTMAFENNLNDETLEIIMINAVKGLTLIGGRDCIKILQELSKNDKSLKVRQAAFQSLEMIKLSARL